MHCSMNEYTARHSSCRSCSTHLFDLSERDGSICPAGPDVDVIVMVGAWSLCFAARGPLCIRQRGRFWADSSSHHIGLVRAVLCYTTTFAALNSIPKISAFRLVKLGLLSPVGPTAFTTGWDENVGVGANVVTHPVSRLNASTILCKFTEIS